MNPMGSDVSSGGLKDRLRREALRLGLDAVGIAPLSASEHGAFYRRWLAAGRHGEMAYLAREDAVARRLDPAAAFPGARSAIVVAERYDPGEGDAGAATDPALGIVARYARGRDYHKVLRRKLLRLLEWLEGEVGGALPLARAYVDTGPVFERELARRAGLGWFGRNTMLIHPRRGSYFFLGVLLAELEIEPDTPFDADHCGTCRACVDACPTGALLGRDEGGAPIIDAARCISYLTIELRGPIPRALRPLIGNRVFGCDICQEVCPFSDPAYGSRGPGEPPAGVDAMATGSVSHPGTGTPSLVALMRLDEAGWDSFSRGSALRRAGRSGFLRNVAVALGNWGSPAAVPVLAAGLSDGEPLIRGHAAWALGRIGSAEAVAALTGRLTVEPDEWVRDELSAALTEATMPVAERMRMSRET